MSSLEEPSAKIPKIELKNDEELDEGHEEWLSEDILTDDDYNASNAPHLNSTQANAASSMDVDAAHQMENSVQNPNDLEKSQETDLPGELSTFLVRKKDVRSDAKRPSDGNDTDELLSMLGDDDHSKVSGSRREIKNDSSDDDDYIFDGAKVSHLKVASNAIMKKMPSRAIPEDSDRDSDMSSDERQTVKKMFGVARGGISNVASKSTAKSSLIAMRDMMNLNIDDKELYEPVRYAYDLMQSLLLSDSDVNTGTSTLENEEHDETNVTENDPHHVHNIDDNIPRRSSQSSCPLSGLSDKDMSSTLEQLTHSLILRHRSSIAEEDECELYSKLLVRKLRQLPEDERKMMINQIDGLFRGKLDQN